MAGLGAGALYFGALWRSVAPLAGGDASYGRLMAGALARIASALAVIALAAWLGAGAGPLAAAASGFLTVRLAATAAARPRAPDARRG